ncbi:MAG: site-2 protease family protein [Pirellulaceae bacterium]|nr:site-2 protease family protein [Pirellulaceae bacterium]
MLGGIHQTTPLDLNFRFLGFPVRVSPWFWLAALVLGYGPSGGNGVFLLLFIGAAFLSILIHELGHSIAFANYGIGSSIMLYHFGGLAIPDQFTAMGSRRTGKYGQMIISAAGPGIQLLLALVILLLVRGFGYEVVPLSIGTIPILPEIVCLNADSIEAGTRLHAIPNIFLDGFVFFMLYINIFWALLNLLPVYPLDGGQIVREFFVLIDYRDGLKNSLILSTAVAGGVAVWGFSGGSLFMGMLFGMMAFNSFQMFQNVTRGPGGRW